ncbi:MAG: LIC_13387 family protein [Candidatus Korobacteraceae bacterium]
MKASVLYRIASILLVLFAVGHTLGFRKIDASWGVDSLVASMRTIHFDAQGFSRTYWDFYTGFGLFVTVFMLFAAYLAWQLSALPAQTLRGMRGITWAFALCFVAVTVLSWTYFFIAPVVFSSVVTICLVGAAWLSAKPA